MAMYTSLYSKQLALKGEAPGHDMHIEGEKKVQTAVQRRTIDYAGPYINMLEKLCQVRGYEDVRTLQPHAAAALELLPPVAYPHCPATNFNTKFVHVSTNKMRCSVNVVAWTPDGRRALTGAQSGEFTLWNGLSFQFETILQAHETAVREMLFSHNDNWLLTADDGGLVRYWKPNMELVKSIAAHKEAVRGVAFAPSDLKFATASDDSTIRVWDFARAQTEKVLAGHGGDVKCVDWHPHKGVLASGSKDGLVKLWDPSTGTVLNTLHAHRHSVTAVRWNRNGNWILTASRDQMLKVFDARMGRELSSYRGHNRDVLCAEWHPLHEELFASGAHDGSLVYWLVGRGSPQAEVRGAHEGAIWRIAWHPLGHLLASSSQDYSTKFWCRARPGDAWRDRHQREQEEAALEEGEAGGATARGAAPRPSGGAGGAIPGIGAAAAGQDAPLPEPHRPFMGPDAVHGARPPGPPPPGGYGGYPSRPFGPPPGPWPAGGAGRGHMRPRGREWEEERGRGKRQRGQDAFGARHDAPQHGSGPGRPQQSDGAHVPPGVRPPLAGPGPRGAPPGAYMQGGRRPPGGYPPPGPMGMPPAHITGGKQAGSIGGPAPPDGPGGYPGGGRHGGPGGGRGSNDGQRGRGGGKRGRGRRGGRG